MQRDLPTIMLKKKFIWEEIWVWIKFIWWFFQYYMYSLYHCMVVSHHPHKDSSSHESTVLGALREQSRESVGRVWPLTTHRGVKPCSNPPITCIISSARPLWTVLLQALACPQHASIILLFFWNSMCAQHFAYWAHLCLRPHACSGELVSRWAHWEEVCSNRIFLFPL